MINLVGAVDREIQTRNFIERGHVQAGARGPLARGFRSRHADDVEPRAGSLRHEVYEICRCRARAEPDLHSRGDKLEGASRRHLFLGVLRVNRHEIWSGWS